MTTEPTTLRERLLGTVDLPTEQVKVSEWNATLRVRAMNAGERVQFAKMFIQGDGETTSVAATLDSNVFLVWVCTLAEDGSRLFEKDDRKELSKKSPEAIDKIANVARRLSGLGGEDLQDAVVNFTDVASIASDSDWQDISDEALLGLTQILERLNSNNGACSTPSTV